MRFLKVIFMIFYVFIFLSCEELHWTDEDIREKQKTQLQSIIEKDANIDKEAEEKSIMSKDLEIEEDTIISRLDLEFKNQIIGNTINKIVFRQDVGGDAEEWAKLAGTFSSRKKTYQIMGAEESEEMTGLGTLRDTKEMRIEFDVFQKLSQGEAVLIDKALHKEDVFKVWRTIL